MTATIAGLDLAALESDPATAATIRAAAAAAKVGVLDIVTDIGALVAVVAERRPALLVVDLAHTGIDVSGAVRDILAVSPESCIVVTGADVTPSVISRAVSAGARGFILRPFGADELATTMRDAYANLADLRRLQRGEHGAARARGSVIAFYSPKGGVGCSTIAANVAVALASRSKRPVGLVDLDLQFGDIGVLLDLRGANSVIDLIAHEDQIDSSVVDELFVRHESGVRALLAPEIVGSTDPGDADALVRAVNALRSHFTHIVCDLSSGLDEITLGVLRVADQIVLVSTPELPSLKNLRRAIAATPLLADERTQVVLNRHPGKAGVSIADVEKNLGRRVAWSIPSEGIGVTHAINQGISLFDQRARVRASRSYLRLAEGLLNGDRAKPVTEIAAPARA